MAALWSMTDEAIRSAIDEEMGQASAYPDHKLDNVQIVETWDFYTPPYPRGLVYSNNSVLTVGGFGDGLQHIDSAYEYLVAIVATAEEYGACRSLAQTLHDRARDVFRKRFTDIVGLIGDDGEQSNRIEWQQAYIEIRGRNQPGKIAGTHVGVSVFLFTVEASI